MMEDLLKRHIQETDKSFDDIKEEMKNLSLKIEDLRDFKMQILISSRFFSLVVSAICGLVTLVASSIITYYVNLKLNRG